MASAPHPQVFRRAVSTLLAALTALSPAAAIGQARPEATRTIPSSLLNYKTEQPVRAQHGMVVSVHHLASDAGLQILQKGGDAIDAAVATAFTLAVVYPFAGNLGGGGFMLIHLSGHDHVPVHEKLLSVHTRHNTIVYKGDTFIDFREAAPIAATPTMYLDGRGRVIPNASILGPQSIGVPGSVAGLALAEKEYGLLKLGQVMAPAIRLAEKGFVLTAEEASMLNSPHLRDYPATSAIFAAQKWHAGDTLRQPELARTLRRIADNPDSFYRGDLAKQLAAAFQDIGSPITAQDLANYHAIERTPLHGTYLGQTVIASPPPSSGGVTLLETLNILGAQSTPDMQAFGDRSPEWIHWITEAFRRAYLDRNQYLGDPAFVHIPVEAMLSPAYAAAWRATIDPARATPSTTLTRPAGFLPAPPTSGDEHLKQGEKPETTHFSVIDANGDAVAMTTTLNGAFGSYETAPGLGFLLNDEMDDFTSKPGEPNMFGLVQGAANAIAPGKRPLSSMTPTILLAKDGSVRMVLGSPGGARIISTVANILLSTGQGGLNIQSAVDAPRFHHQNLPDTLYLEPGFSDSTRDALTGMGYTLSPLPGEIWSDGECLARDPATGVITAGQDHRRPFGKAAGY